MEKPVKQISYTRRGFIRNVAAAVSAMAAGPSLSAASQVRKPTNFQLACMTLPYRQYTFQRALEGLVSSGFEYVALGTRHLGESGEPVPLLELDAPLSKARELGKRCRDMGLEPVMMFAGSRPEVDAAVEIHTKRIKQAAAAGVEQILTMGHTQGGRYEHWIKNLKALGPIARDAGVIVVVKQHGGETATGEATGKLIREVDDEGIRISYDAGNVLDYVNIDPLKDIQHCLGEIRSFCIKDHRNYPKDQDCGPGFGEIDHYRLLAPLTYTGLDMPLAFENIFAPLLPRPTTAEGVDALAKRAREYVETVVRGLQAEA